MAETIRMRVAGHQAAAATPGKEQVQINLGAIDQQAPANLSFTVPKSRAGQYSVWATIEVSVKVVEDAKSKDAKDD